MTLTVLPKSNVNLYFHMKFLSSKSEREKLGAKYALITQLDSEPNPATLKLDVELKEFKVLEGAILVPFSELLNKFILDRLFYGYDTVWLFDREITYRPEIMNENFEEWMQAEGCILVLRDAFNGLAVYKPTIRDESAR